VREHEPAVLFVIPFAAAGAQHGARNACNDPRR